MIPKRKIALNAVGVALRRREGRDRRREARPVRTATGIASTTSGDATAPNTAMTTVKTTPISVSRIAIQAMLPRTMSRGAERRREHRVVTSGAS